tara:strand:+ start:713 stop:1567 length:855 start_codon:yes stop_codon:yes gene_type:complete
MANLFVKTVFDATSWNAGIKKMRAGMNNYMKESAKGFAGQFAGMMAIESVARGITNLYSHAAQVRDAAIMYDTDTDTYQKMAAAAESARMPVDRFYDAVKDLAVKQHEAMNGSKSWLAVFERYGFTLDDLRDKSPVEMFQSFAKAVNEAGQETGRMGQILADLDDLMSDPGAELTTAITQGKFNNISSRQVLFDSQDVQTLAEVADTFRAAFADAKILGAKLLSTTWDKLGNYYGAKFGMLQNVLSGDAFRTMRMENELERKKQERENNDALKDIADGVNRMSS